MLQLFYSNPNRSFYVREITRKIDEQINSVRRELANLLSIGIISSDNTNNRLYYEVNQKYEYYKPLAAIFGNEKLAASTDTAVSVDGDAKAIKSLGNVEVAILTGQFTRDERPGVDFILVGDVNQTKLNKFIEEWESREGKDIRYAVMPAGEFEYRRQVNDRFLTTVLESKIQVMIDKHDTLTEKKPEKVSKEK